MYSVGYCTSSDSREGTNKLVIQDRYKPSNNQHSVCIKLHSILHGNLVEKSNMHFLHIANSDKPVTVYSLDVIISVGYRVKSQRGVEFRRWANSVLKDYILRGYAINDKRVSR